MAYATVEDVRARYTGDASEGLIASLLDEAEVLIDSYNKRAKTSVKKLVSVRMVIRTLGSGSDDSIPVGATQGTISGLGYSQTWTMGSGGITGEIYMSKTEKRLLGYGDRIGCRSPLEDNECVE